MRRKVIDTSCGPIPLDEDLYRDNANTIFLADEDLQAVEYVTMAEHKRVCAKHDRLRDALDHALKGDLDPEDRVIIAQILDGAALQEDNDAE